MNLARQESESIELAVLLALAGGTMDCYSYLVRDKVFANAQTGNMLLFGVSVAERNWGMCLHYAVPVVCFALGIALCHAIKLVSHERHLHWRQVALAVEIVALAVVSQVPVGHSLWANGITSFACGIQVQAFRKFQGRALATTMCIGNLRSGTQSMVGYVHDRDSDQLRGGLLSYFTIVCFVLGAVIGSALIPAMGTLMILVAPAFLLACFLIMFVDRERRHVEQIVEKDLEADLAGVEPVRQDADLPVTGLAEVERRVEERVAHDVERRHAADIELDVLHDMGLTAQEGDGPADAVSREVEAQIERDLRDHIARGGWRARR